MMSTIAIVLKMASIITIYTATISVVVTKAKQKALEHPNPLNPESLKTLRTFCKTP